MEEQNQPQNEPQLIEPSKDKFSKREIALIVIVLIAIVGVALYAWKADKNKETAINSFADCVAAGNPVMDTYPEQCAANGQTFTNPNQQSNTLPDETETAYVEVTELGVKFDKTVGMEGIYYLIEPSKPNIAYFSLEEFKGTDCAADKTSQVALAKWTEADIAADEQLQMAKASMQVIDGFYFQASGGQAACSEDEAVQGKATVLRSEVVSSVGASLQAIE